MYVCIYVGSFWGAWQETVRTAPHQLTGVSAARQMLVSKSGAI
jgi:hypothetical protein